MLLYPTAFFENQGPSMWCLKQDLGPLEEILRAKVLKMLKAEGKIGDALINNLMSWKHNGFSVHNGVRIAKDDDVGKENVATT